MANLIKASPYTNLFWTEHQINPLRNDYNIVFDQTIRGELDLPKLSQTLAKLVNDHVLMSSHLLLQKDGLYWERNKDTFELEIYENTEKEKHFVEQPFSLSKEPLYRFAIFKIAQNQCDLIIVLHHALLDGGCFDEFLNLVSNYYNQYQEQIPIYLQIEKIVEVNNSLHNKIQKITDNDNAARFWKDALKDQESKNNISCMLLKDGGIGDYRFSICKSIFDLKSIKKLGLSLFAFMSTAFGFMISAYCSSHKALISFPIGIKEGSGLIFGGQINTAVLPISYTVECTVQTLMEKSGVLFKEIMSANVKYAYLPTSQIVANSSVSRLNIGFAQTNLKDKKLAFQKCNTAVNNRYNIDIGGLDLLFAYEEEFGNVKFHVKYNTQLFTNCYVKQMATELYSLLAFFGNDKNFDTKLSAISLMCKKDYVKVLRDWNRTYKDNLTNKTIVHLIKRQAMTSSSSKALVFQDQPLPSKLMANSSQQVATCLQAYMMRNVDTMVALYLPRSQEIIIDILGIMMAGFVYVPIDMQSPMARLNHILAETKVDLVLTHLESVVGIKADQTDWNFVQIELDQKVRVTKKNFAIRNSSTDVAYVLYTSGTTGTPKGVVISQRNLVSSIAAQTQRYVIGTESNVLQFTSIMFDASGLEIYLALTSGSTLYIIEDNYRKVSKLFANFVTKSKVDFVVTVPTFFSAFEQTQLNTISTIILGGETCPRNIVNRFSEDHKLINAYGPTECTIIITTRRFCKYDYISYNIGKPLNNTTAYVVNQYNVPVPIRVTGELLIGGANLARGYFNKENETEKYFIDNNFAKGIQDIDNRMYKTGDRVKWTPCGNLEYVGRFDFQVKIRGHRIELGEIESILSTIEIIKQSCVLVKEQNDNKYLVVYFTTENNVKMDEKHIISKLRLWLPEYMVPTKIVHLDRFPEKSTGKLDRTALIEGSYYQKQSNYLAPENQLEEILCAIVSKIVGLDVSDISTNESFFRLGLDSVLSIRLQQELMCVTEFESITTVDVYKHNTIRKLIDSLEPDDKIQYCGQQLLHKTENFDVAIVGLSGAFTDACDVAELWDMLINQEEGIRFYDYKQCEGLGVEKALLQNTNFVPVAAHVKNVELFHPLFWSMSLQEAKLLDPQIRKFLEHSWFVLELSGYITNRKSLNIGVSAGSGTNMYFDENIANEALEDIDNWEVAASNSTGAIATKAAYCLGLTGPANSVNTACSTSLVTVVEGCKDLHISVCDAVLAGGVSLIMPRQIGYLYKKGMILSQDGHCRTFDKNASGTTLGSGLGVILLRHLEIATKTRDNIVGVITGYATNNDGDRKIGYVAPSVVGQTECVINAQKMAMIESHHISYIECHGTGTKLGDAIEIQALKEAFEYNRNTKDSQKCNLGAIKANIGHTDVAAGICGLIKVCRMLQTQIIPGQTNFNLPNPELHLERTNFHICTQNTTWLPNTGFQRLAGVSSFGIGGTNAHVILAEHILEQKENSEIAHTSQKRYVFTMSAKTKTSLKLFTEALARYLSNSIPDTKTLPNIAFTLQEKRELFGCRCGLSATRVDELFQKLNKSSTDIVEEADLFNNNSVAFMFPGQGSQYKGMAKSLLLHEVEFENTFNFCNGILCQYVEADLYNVLYPDLKETGKNNEEYNIYDTLWAQLSLFTISYSLAKLLEGLKIHPDAYIGHSIGEFVAATLIGIFRLEDAIKIVVQRGKLMQSMQLGSMLAVHGDRALIHTLSKEFSCDIAVINSPNNIVISGSYKHIALLKNVLEEKGMTSSMLKTSHAFHSKMMKNAATKFAEVLEQFTLHKPQQFNFASNLTGEWANKDVLYPAYWANSLRYAVKFATGIETICNYFKNKVSFIEVGPGRVLCSHVKRCLQQAHKVGTIQILPSFSESKKSINYQYKDDIIALLWANNVVLKANHFSELSNVGIAFDLPTYQFDSQYCWKRITNESTKTDSVNSLKLLPKDRWLNTSIWKPICNIKINNKVEPVFNSAIIFAGKNQKHTNSILIAEHQYFVIFDDNIVDICYGERNKIAINPRSQLAYEKLSSFLPAKKKFDAVIHIATLDVQDKSDGILQLGFYSIFKIKEYLFPKIDMNYLFILTWGLFKISDTDLINPFNGAMVGATRNMNQENPEVNKFIIDVGNTFKMNFSFLSHFIPAHNSIMRSNSLFAIKYGSLWCQEQQEIILKPNQNYIIENNDTILITGGVGRFGLTIAEHISTKHNVNLILTSKNKIDQVSDKSKHATAIIDKIKLNQCKVEIICGDISDKAFAKKLVEDIELNIGHIHGIIHAAGVLPVEGRCTVTHVISTIEAKVCGIENISRCMNRRHLKFIANTGSLASIMGDVNRIEYCAANSYLDFLCFEKDVLKNVRVTSVSMPGLSFGRTKRSMTESSCVDKHHLLMESNTIDGSEMAEIFYNCINQDSYQHVIVSKYNIRLLKNAIFSSDNVPTMPSPLSQTITITENDYSQKEQEIAAIFCQILDLKEISLDDDFFNIGGNSVLAVQLVSKLRAIGININLQSVIECNTVKLIAQHMKDDKETTIIVPLKVAGTTNRKNIFFVHAVGGSVVAYNEMASQLDQSYNYYGIQNINIYNKQLIEADSLEMLAEIYIQEVLLIQPDGDYILGGSSMGGTLAYEMAYQLQKLGKKIQFVAMFDSWVVFNDSHKNKAYFENEMIRQSHNFYKDLVNIDDVVRKYLIEARWELMRLLIEYEPPDSTLVVHLYKANVLNDLHLANGPMWDNGWQKYTSADLQVHHIDGDHNTMLMDRGLLQICNIFSQSLRSQK